MNSTIFTPWGGPVNCSTIADCVESAIPGNFPGHLSTCVTFTGDDLPEWVPLNQPVCSCNINYGRSGVSCGDLDNSNLVYILLLIPNILLNAYASYYIGKTTITAHKLNLLNIGVNKITLSFLILGNVVSSAWPLVRVWLYAGAPPLVYDINLILASLSATVIVVLLLILTLLFRQVLVSSRKLRKGGNKGIGRKEKLFVGVSSTVVVLTMFGLMLTGHNSLAARVAIVFFLSSFLLYLYTASQMKRLMVKSFARSSGNASDKALAAVHRIQKCIFKVMIFILWFIPSAVLYSVTSTDLKSSSITTVPIASLALESVHFSGACCVFWMAQYSSEPILKKRAGSSSVLPTSSAPQSSVPSTQ